MTIIYEQNTYVTICFLSNHNFDISVFAEPGK